METECYEKKFSPIEKLTINRLLIGRQSGMTVRMPLQLINVNDESIVGKILFLDVYTWN